MKKSAFSCRSACLPYKVHVTDWPSIMRRAVGDTVTSMKQLLIGFAALVAAANTAMSATAVNKDGEPRTIVVTEGGDKSELSIAAGETLDFCPNGCFVTMPNGDREALTGSETIEILDGVARIK